MRDVDEIIADIKKQRGRLVARGGDGFAFQLGKLRVILSWGDGWEHASVSLEQRTPVWQEMERIKRLVWNDDETAMQLHVPVAEHINCHPDCLHLWRPLNAQIPRPPDWMV
jgi:hypothetical protein